MLMIHILRVRTIPARECLAKIDKKRVSRDIVAVCCPTN